MAAIESPECPVCLQPYDDATAVIPRVLTCGHSACELCLAQLPHPFSTPTTIRCPACTQIVNYPHPLGAAALPKNIDLLRFSLALLDKTQSDPKPTNKKKPTNQHTGAPRRLRRFFAGAWSDELYSAWKYWVLPGDSVVVGNGGEETSGWCGSRRGRVVGLGSTNGEGLGFSSDSPLMHRVKGDDEEVSILKIGWCGSSKSEFEYSYMAKVMSVLDGMSGVVREELASIFKLSLRSGRVCKVYGLWFCEKDESLYLVSERKNNTLSEMEVVSGSDVNRAEETETHMPIEHWVSRFATIGLELCEALINLQSEGFVFGCLGKSCFCIDEFWHVYVDLSEVILMGRKLRKCISMALNCEEKIDDEMEEELLALIVKNGVLSSPEILFELLRSEGFHVGSGESRCTYDSSSDVWSLGCIYIELLSGKQLAEDMYKYLKGLITAKEHSELVNECKARFMDRVEQVTNILGDSVDVNLASLVKILLSCLDYDPKSRPDLTVIWKGVKEVVIESGFSGLVNLKGLVSHKTSANCLVLGELCGFLYEIENELKSRKLPKTCNEGGTSCGQAGEVKLHKKLASGISEHKVASIDLERHRDCVSQLRAGGGFLFSSSYDKTINIWSLQDFSHVHTFKGHQHRITALAFMYSEKPLFISGDNGGGIFIWEICTPFAQEPLKNWYEPKDWRYSGIYALVAPGNEFLYTGSGDRLIKAWSLKDYTLTCSMEGHKSVVSALATFNNVLYSGSWDGSIRLWNLHDHSALAVLDENMPGAISSVHSIFANHQTVVSAYENGSVKIWLNGEIKRSFQIHDGAVLAISMEERWLYTGGWDRIVKVQEITGDKFELDARQVGSITCGSVITALLCGESKLFVGYGNGLIKVYHHE